MKAIGIKYIVITYNENVDKYLNTIILSTNRAIKAIAPII